MFWRTLIVSFTEQKPEDEDSKFLNKFVTSIPKKIVASYSPP